MAVSNTEGEKKSGSLVGLTGGIASGKSTVSGMFSDLGIPVVDADQVAREVVLPGTDGLEAVVEAFGESVLLEDGTLNRPELGRRVFDDPELRARLNGILHPRIGALSAQKLAEAAKGAPYAIYDAALLVENGLHRAFAKLVVVTVDSETQIERLSLRDTLDRQAAEKRIAAQMPLSEKASHADYLIDNGGSLSATRDQVIEVDRTLRELASKGKLL